MAQRRATWEDVVGAFLAEGRRTNLSVSTLENYRAYLARAAHPAVSFGSPDQRA